LQRVARPRHPGNAAGNRRRSDPVADSRRLLG
jgi:hypothetical protein